MKIRKHFFTFLTVLVLLSQSYLAKAAVSVIVDPGTYTGQWAITGINDFVAGTRVVSLEPGRYQARVGTFGNFFFNLAPDGTVTVENGVSAVGGVGTLTFNTTMLSVTPAAFGGQWAFSRVTEFVPGPGTVIVVPGVTYMVLAGTFGGFFIDVAGDGTVTVQNGVSAVGGLGVLTFNTMSILVNPGLYTARWHISRVTNFVFGSATVLLVPGVNYQFITDIGSMFFTIASPCAVNPSQFIIGSFTFNIICAGPIANAGPDQTVDEGTLVTLDGSGSSASQGGALTYAWTQVAGPVVTLNTSNPVQPTFTAPFVSVGGATVTFQLIVTEGTRSSEPDVVNIHVRNVNNRPVADAGADQTVQEGSPVVLNGTNSYDPDAETLSFSWVQSSGTLVSLSGANTANPSFTAPSVGPAGATLTIELTVSDGIDSVTDTVNVFVENVNHRPSANAGPDRTKDEGSLVTLNGTGSNDPDGDALNYAWTQISGPLVALSDANTANPSFTAPAVGPGGATLVFQLVVDDGLGGISDPDEVNITVQNINDPPACNLAQASLATLWPPNHKLVSVGMQNVSDPNNDQVSITITGVTQDEPVNGLGDGDTSPDAVLRETKFCCVWNALGTATGASIGFVSLPTMGRGAFARAR